MSEHPLQAFIDLVTFDREHVALETDGQKFEQEIVDLNNKSLQLAQTLEQAKTCLHDARKEVDERELEMKELDAQHEKEKERLETVTNTKQYQAIKNEIESLKKAQSNLDETLLDSWNRLETAQKEHGVLEKEVEKKLAEQQKAIQEKESSVVKVKARIEKLAKIRPDKEKLVPAEWLERYSMMRARVDDPVVPVLHGSCSACFWAIPSQDLLTLKRKALLQCNGCYRFLYIDEEEEKAMEKAKELKEARKKVTKKVTKKAKKKKGESLKEGE